METITIKYQKMGFLGVPDEVIVTTGTGIAGDPLSAFDMAEIDAGATDINAISVTSFVPPGAVLRMPQDGSKQYLRDHPIVPGSLVPAALKSYASTREQQKRKNLPVDKIFAGIGVARPKDAARFPSILMEFAGPSEPTHPRTAADVKRYCSEMCDRAVDTRRPFGFVPDGAPMVSVVEVELPRDGEWACALVAALYVKFMPY
ncbi:MAG TPA: pyruvoyl-dependent arginine decarboxylase [Pirellulales bacterium]|nr:pyruvoyl-dependent arginine decarboxylase [Pirellulales bacterium]